MDSDEKLKEFIEKTRKIYGVDSIFTSQMKPLEIEWVKSSIHSINEVFGCGIPRGRIIEIYGPESSGKTTLSLEIVKSFQNSKYMAMFIDSEHAFDTMYAKNVGVNIDKLAISQPDDAESALNLLLTCVNSGIFGVIIVDSVASLIPRAEIDGEIGDSHMALLAKLMSSTLRQLVKECKKTSTTVVFINQIRYKVGVFFGSPEFQPGGVALKFHSSIRVDIRKKDVITDGDKFKGIISRIKIVKNKVAPPFGQAMINILFNKGIDGMSDLRRYLLSNDRLVLKGSNYYLDGDNRIGAGKEKTDDWLKENFDQYEKDRGVKDEDNGN